MTFRPCEEAAQQEPGRGLTIQIARVGAGGAQIERHRGRHQEPDATIVDTDPLPELASVVADVRHKQEVEQ